MSSWPGCAASGARATLAAPPPTRGTCTRSGATVAGRVQLGCRLTPRSRQTKAAGAAQAGAADGADAEAVAGRAGAARAVRAGRCARLSLLVARSFPHAAAHAADENAAPPPAHAPRAPLFGGSSPGTASFLAGKRARRAAAPAPQPAGASPTPGGWAAHAELHGGAAAAAGARRRGAPTPLATLSSYASPGSTPSPLRPAAPPPPPPPPGAEGTPQGTPQRATPTPSPLSQQQLQQPPSSLRAPRDAAPARLRGVEHGGTQTTPGLGYEEAEARAACERLQQQPPQPQPRRASVAEAACGPSPGVWGAFESPRAHDGGGGGDDGGGGFGGGDDDMACAPPPGEGGGGGGWDEDGGGGGGGGGGGDGGMLGAEPTPARRPRAPAGTPNKRLRKDFASRQSLAGAGLRSFPDEGSGEVLRRSTRPKLRPLEYWRGETKAFSRTHHSLPTVAAVTLRSPEPQWPAPAGWKPPRARAGKVAPHAAHTAPHHRAAGAAAAGVGAAPRARGRFEDSSDEEEGGGGGGGGVGAPKSDSE